MRIWLVVSVASAAWLAARSVPAQTADGNPSSPELTPHPTRRSGFTLGTSGGFGFGRARGYPNEVDKIGEGEYASNTGLGLGSGGAVWIGVAFNDYLTFGLGMGGLGLTGNDREASAGTFLFHVDAYPLFDVDKSLRDLGLFGHVGTGPLQITGGDEKAEGGLMGYIEGGVVYEGLRIWRFGMGPSVSVLHMWSESAKMTAALIGGRLAFYGGP